MFKQKKIKFVDYYLMFALVATLLLNIWMDTSGWILWVSAFASIFNLWLTSKMSKWFIIPDLIWLFCMVIIVFQNKLLWDGMQYIYYFLIAFFQFRSWSKHTSNDDQGIEVKMLSNKSRIIIAIIIIILIPVLKNIEALIVGEGVYLDGLNTSLAFAGSLLLSMRYFDAHVIYFLSNVFSMLLYIERGVPSVALTMLLFSGFALISIINWYRKYKRQEAQIKLVNGID